MKFKKWIDEEDQKAIDFFNNEIKPNCKKYFKINSINTPLYRGVSNINSLFGIKDVRKNRKPLGTNNDAFKIINNFLDKKGHTRRDRSISATSKKSDLDIFGTPCVIFPKGDFKYTWIKLGDFNHWGGWDKQGYSKVADFLMGDTFSDKKNEEILNNINSILTTNKDLKTAIQKKYEVWFDCKNYYFMNLYLFEKVKGDLNAV